MVDIVLNNDGYEMKNKYVNNGSNNYPTEEDRIKLKVIFRKNPGGGFITQESIGLSDFKIYYKEVREKLI